MSKDIIIIYNIMSEYINLPLIKEKKNYKKKYDKYILCPICNNIFNLLRSNQHINSKKCSYIQTIKDKGDNITHNEKLFLKINEQKTKIKNDDSNISGNDTSNPS